MTKLLSLLQEMNSEQKQALVKILGLKATEDQEIALKISKILLPAKGWLQEPMTYKQFITSIAEKNSETADFSKGIFHAERELYLKLFQNEFEKLSQEEKDKIFDQLENAGLNRNQIASLSGIGALGAAQLSGFGIYILASSTVGAITSLLGITLPFALYTGMSSAISFVIGPVGFLVMGVMIYRSFKHVKTWDEAVEIFEVSWKEMGTLVRGDFAKGTQIFKYIAASRIILENNFQQEIEKNNVLVADLKSQISTYNTEYSNETSNISNIADDVKQIQTKKYFLKQEIRQLERKIESFDVELVRKEQEILNVKNRQENIVKAKESKYNLITTRNNNSEVLSKKIKNITQ